MPDNTPYTYKKFFLKNFLSKKNIISVLLFNIYIIGYCYSSWNGENLDSEYLFGSPMLFTSLPLHNDIFSNNLSDKRNFESNSFELEINPPDFDIEYLFGTSILFNSLQHSVVGESDNNIFQSNLLHKKNVDDNSFVRKENTKKEMNIPPISTVICEKTENKKREIEITKNINVKNTVPTKKMKQPLIKETSIPPATPRKKIKKVCVKWVNKGKPTSYQKFLRKSLAEKENTINTSVGLLAREIRIKFEQDEMFKGLQIPTEIAIRDQINRILEFKK